MNILLLGGFSSDTQDQASLTQFHEYLRRILEGRAQIYATYLDDLEFSVAPGSFDLYDTRNRLGVSNVDRLIIRGPKMRTQSEYAYYVSRFCKLGGLSFWNDYTGYYPGTKFAQATVFYEQEAPFLKTLFSINKTRLCDLAAKELGYPYILKTNAGSHGNSNYLIRSALEAEQAITREPETLFIAQEYCPNDRDYRLLLVGDQQLIFERRGRGDLHTNNTSKGADIREADAVLPQELVAQARHASRLLGLTIAGVDVMPRLGSGEFYFLEINSQPQLRAGAFLEKKAQLIERLMLDSD